MKLSIIIPCYNEINTLSKIIDLILNNPYQDIEIIIVDDCSTDGTRELLVNELEKNKKIYKVIYHENNLGKGAAIQSALKYITGDLVIIQDADLEYDPNEYIMLLKPILDNRADVVYGSRFQSSAPHRVLFFWHSMGNYFLTLLSNIFTNLNLTDMECGYKVFKSDIIKKVNLREKRFGFEPEVTAKISKLNCRIYEVGISYYGRSYREGKKIGWKDGIRALYCIVKYGIMN